MKHDSVQGRWRSLQKFTLMGGRRGRLHSVPLLAWVVAALVVVGLLPFAITAYQIRVSRDGIIEQVQQTHRIAVRSTADRVGAFLALMQGAAAAAAANPNLYTEVTASAAEEVLTGILTSHPAVLSAGIYRVDREAPEVVRAALRRGAARVEEAVLAVGEERPLAAVDTAAGRWLQVRTALEDERLVLLLIADLSGLEEILLARDEVGSEMALTLLAAEQGVLLGTLPSLDGFPPELVGQVRSGRLGSGANEYALADGERLVAAFADVPGSSWYVLSRQPAEEVEVAVLLMRQAAWQTFSAVLVVVGLLSVLSYRTVIRPLRRLIGAQRRLAGDAESEAGGEIAQLERSFAKLARNIHDRETISKVFLGRYQVVAQIGMGAMGSVFRGWDPKLQRPVALKTIRIDTVDEAKRRELGTGLVREAVTLARLSHPHIVTVFDVADAEEAAFIAMELVEGLSLETYLWKNRHLPSDQVMVLGVAIFRALAAAHAEGIVHHDVKPANVLLGRDGSIKMTDFGISEVVSNALQKRDVVCGTPGYLAPEALLGEGYTPLSDLFAAGVVLYQCLTAKRPFRGRNPREVMLATLKGGLVAPRTLRSTIPPLLDELIVQLLDSDPAARPADAAAAAAVLEAEVASRGLRWSPAPIASLAMEEESHAPERPHTALLPTSSGRRPRPGLQPG